MIPLFGFDSAEQFKTWMEGVKAAAEAMALAAGGVFLVYKILSGYHVVNVSIGLGAQRVPKPGSNDLDLLSIVTTLKKGERGSIVFWDARARFFDGDEELFVSAGAEPTDARPAFPDVERYSYDARQIEWKPSGRAPYLKMTPGDSMELAMVREVARDRAIRVEVVVLGRKRWSVRVAQWRSSIVSLPGVYAKSEAKPAVAIAADGAVAHAVME
jgi:hypothetical protein